MTRNTQSNRLGRLTAVLSAERIDRYRWGGVSREVAVGRYGANIAACEAFYPVLQMLEVILRNQIVSAISDELPNRYPGVRTTPYSLNRMPPGVIGSWLDPDFLSATWPKGLAPLLTTYAIREVKNARDKLFKVTSTLGRSVTEGQLVAALDFGFWTGLFHKSYVFRSGNDPRLWGSRPHHPNVANNLLFKIFPHRRPQFVRINEIGPLLNDFRKFRNRVFHHEPILASTHKDPLVVYQEILEVTSWIEPEASRIIDSLCRVREILADAGKRRIYAVMHKQTWR